jgi:ketosteroid isomerase-like protein
MSQADIETLRAGFDAYNDGDFERMLETWDEDAELVRLGGGEPLRGKEAIRSWLVPEAIHQSGEPIAFCDYGERVLVTCDWHVRGMGSGVEVDTRLFLLFTLRAGKVTRLENFGDEQEALEAAGLTE